MGKGRVRVILAGILFFAGALSIAAPEEGLRLEAMRERLLERPFEPVPPEASPGWYEEILDQATDGLPWPIDCLTPLSGASRRPDAAGTALALLARPPALRSGESHPVGDWLSIRFTTDLSSPHAIDAWDGNADGLPDLVERIAWAAEGFHEIAVRRYGFAGPSARSAGARWEIVLVRMPDPVAGMTVPPVPGGDPGFILLDPDDLSVRESWGSVPHQLAHASLFLYSREAPAWWQEATAVWLEKEVTNDVGSHRTSVSARLRSPHLSLATDRVELLPGGYLWPLFLVEAHGDDPALIRSIWEAMAESPAADPLRAADRLLRLGKETTFEEAFLRFAIWNHHTGRRDVGNHYRFASHLPDSAAPSRYDTYPSVARPADTALEPIATRVVALDGEAARGGLEFHFFGGEGARWQVAALVTDPERGRRSYFLRLEVDPSHRGRFRLPWDDVGGVTLFIQNLGGDRDGESRFGFTALYDPQFPYTLSGFAARPERGQVVLEWSTSSEQDLLGWNLYRSSDPLRGFTRINRLMLPGGGDSDEATHYLFVDDRIGKDRQVYYYLEGVTLEGFGQRSHIVGTRTAGGGRGRRGSSD